MARDRANVRIEIWTDDDWRDLSMRAQWLYMLLLTHGSLSNAGVADWRSGRIAALAAGVKRAEVEKAGAELEERHFIVTDEDTEEVLIRSFLRHDGLMTRPNVAVSMAKAFAAIGSDRIRGVVVHELQRLREEHPEWPAWDRETVARLLEKRSLDIRAEGSTDHSGNGSGNSSTNGSGNGSGNDPLTTTTSTATATATPSQEKGGARGARIPDPFVVTASMRKWAAEEVPAVDVDASTRMFVDHWRAKTGRDATKLDWPGTWRNWLRKDAKDVARSTPRRGGSTGLNDWLP